MVDLFGIEEIYQKAWSQIHHRVVIQAGRQPWLNLKYRFRSGTEFREGSQFGQPHAACVFFGLMIEVAVATIPEFSLPIRARSLMASGEGAPLAKYRSSQS